VTYRLVIATPVAEGSQVYADGYVSALAQLLRDNQDVRLLPARITYSRDIVRARNRLAAMVLREMPDATHVLWWDSDVVPHDVGVVARMLNTGASLIGCPYLRKRMPGAWTHRPIVGKPAPVPGDVTMPVRSLGFGFTITSTELLRTVSLRARHYVDKRTDGSRHTVKGIFDLAYLEDESGDYVQESEDYSFCHRSPVIPKLYIGPGSLLSHVGDHAFTPGAK
jgi:hypothetical protein